MTVRPVQALIDTDDPAWPELDRKLSTTDVPVDVLPVEPARAREALFRLQVTARSVLGALVLNTGGLLIDHGWLRILGGGHAGLPDVATMSGMPDPTTEGEPPGGLIFAIDVLGGMFAINGGGLPGKPGGICHFGSETLTWQPIGGGHSAFVDWVLSGGMDGFYADLRWDGWRDEVENLQPDQGLSVYPPLWSAQGRADIAATSRRSCPLLELTALHLDTAAQFDDQG
ncbi:DUF2625 family protein [Nocardia sp. NPDC005825]|uniref:DUF2625 family protein n=1 Tax=unclassified Nocardia TaxID=2637762 RepID=UPI0033C58413